MNSRGRTNTHRSPLCGPSVFVLLWAFALGCTRNAMSDGLSESQDCSACHGSPGNPAPPKAVDGTTSTTHLGVGAHAAHVLGTGNAAPVACVECHPQPTDLLTHPALVDRPAAMVFGSLSTTGGAVPAWDRAKATCGSTYCHGGTLFGRETRSAPVWTRVDGSQRACTSCHGFPPGGTHSTSTECERCHGDVGPGGAITTPALHVNGVVDFVTLGKNEFGSTGRRLAANVGATSRWCGRWRQSGVGAAW